MEENSNPCPDSNTHTANSSSSNNRNQATDHLHLLNKTSHKISKSHHHLHLNHTSHNSSSNNQQQQQQQPPVYNIDKSDFRQLVQKLTSSPSPPPPPPTNPSSRLHRIRPPPLAHVTNACPPPPLLNDAGGGIQDGLSRSPFSPLPPFPTVSIAAESPISAYLRYLRSSAPTSADADPRRSHNPSSLQPMSSSSAAASPFLLSPGLPVPSPRWKDM
ncbi:hypothetical protein MRB53_021986 [Persea americana]|uniref:Uncharacterized protein n=1 Tax=Persea americana TaxID=3435 RepID=A0ACC2L6I0_PERAE|nr:hypothetical protein MRB53_021986 [Persea americana]